MTCASCGAQNPSYAIHCISCGKPLVGADVQSAQAQSKTGWWIAGCLGLGLLVFVGMVAAVVVAIQNLAKEAERTSSAPPPRAVASPLGNPVPLPGFVGLPGQNQYLDLDTQDGHNSSWRHAQLGTASALFAAFRVVRLGSHPTWRPAFFIGVQGPTALPWYNHWVGLRMTPVSGSTASLVAEIDVVGNDRRHYERHFLKVHPDLDQRVGITIDWHTPHSVLFTLSNGETQRIEVPWPVASVVASASTGEMEVNPLVLGTLRR